MAGNIKPWICKIWLFFLPNILAGQTVINIGRFEEDLRISNFLPSSGLGRSLAAGDVNGDGIDDILIGAQVTALFHLAGGAAFLVFGNPSLPRLIDLENPKQRVAFWGNGPEDYTGDQVDMFDFSGDGLADIFIGAPQYFGGEHQNKGKIYFLQGRKAWPDEMMLQNNPSDGLYATLHGERPRTQLGLSLSHGDFNGDGVVDFAAVSYFAARPGPLSQQATAYIVWGGQHLASGPIDTPAIAHCTIIPPPVRQVAMQVYAANLDNDAFDDFILILSEATFDATEPMVAGCILWGRQEWPNVIDLNYWQQDINVTGLINHRPSTYVGTRLVTGDFDGSGISDLAVKIIAPGGDPGSFAYLYRDPFKERPKTFAFFDPGNRHVAIIDRHLNHNNFPYHLNSLDWDGDGFDDLIISNSHAYREQKWISEGVVYVLYGSPVIPDSVDLRTNNAKWDVIWGGSKDAEVGHSMAKADLNADGRDDLILGAWTATTKGGLASGEVYVLLNRSTKPNKPIPERSALLPVTPNPFQATTVIWFELSQEETIRLEILDLLGRRVRLLRDGHLPPGIYSALWNGRDEQGNLSASGVYFAVLRMGEQLKKQKLLLLR
jgi:hypothetical protein